MARRAAKGPKRAEAYQHDEKAVLRPEAGTQAQFKKKKPPKTYRYDSSLSPALDWDGQNHARELGEWLLAQIAEAAALDPPRRFAEPRRFGDVVIEGLDDGLRELKAISRPFLDWAGKAERLSFDVPTLPLFVQERLSTKAILETLKGHERDRQMELQLFADPQLSLAQQLEAYEHAGGWVNRLILGDSLVVMNSLLEYEGLGGQVQMIFIDPPYGVKFGSNFQPFVRRRDVKDAHDESMTREPEMVKAYRDTWELGLHSYLTYLRDRLLVARELLTPSGSVFVQISDENVHHVRELMDEIFGTDNFISEVFFVKTSGLSSRYLAARGDYLLWYGRNSAQTKYRQLFSPKAAGLDTAANYTWVELPDGTRRGMTREERLGIDPLPLRARIYKPDNITSQGNPVMPFEYEEKTYRQAWKTTLDGLRRLGEAGRLHVAANSLQYVRYLDDFPAVPITSLWEDTGQGSFLAEKLYVVQTAVKAVERCLLMTTDPGDLVFDPTCGSGTTAYAAEEWGRRWITVDVSRVPLAVVPTDVVTAG